MAAKKSKTWRSKLTKKELKHLKETAGVTTLAGLKRNFEAQAEMRAVPGSIEPCWACRCIAEKLGFAI